MDPTNDFAFKRLFGSKRFQRLTIHFINDCLEKTGKERIAHIEFLPTILDAETSSGKLCIVDVVCQDRAGNRYIVEMQVADKEGFINRLQYYGAKMYVNQLKQGESYEGLKKVSVIAIVNFKIDAFDKKAGCQHKHQL